MLHAQKLNPLPMLDAKALRSAFAKFSTGVTVITTHDGTRPHGITINSFASVSLDPPLVLWSLSKSSNRYPIFAKAQHYAIHVLAHNQQDVCTAFTRKDTDFADIAHTKNAHQVPIFDQHLACFECVHHTTYEGGDHIILVGRVESVDVRQAKPLIFFDSTLGALEASVAPKSA